MRPLLRLPALILFAIAGGFACGSTDHVIGSLLGARASGGASGSRDDGRSSLSGFGGAGGEGATTAGTDGNAGTSGDVGEGAGVGGALDCIPDGNGAHCIPAGCGDGLESSTESCDDGNNADGDGCSAECTWEAPKGTLEAPSYGSAVAISGDTLVSGPFVFRLHGLVWALEASLAPSAPGGGHDPYDDPNNSTFANAVAISDDTIAVGAPNDSEARESAGAVHVFRRAGSTWLWQQKLLPVLVDGTPDGVPAAHFGWQLALSGDTLVVGAQGDDDQGISSGSVYVFERGAGLFSLQAKLGAALPGGAPAGGQYFHFGTAVGLSGNTLVVGSTGAYLHAVTNAAAYVFERTGSAWSPRAKLLPTLPDGASDATSASLFGAAVAIAGNTIVVGDPGSDFSTGCAYVFEHGAAGWSVRAKLQAPTPPADGTVGEFGGATAIANDGELILIGSPSDTHPVGYASGSGHVFKRDGDAWVYDGELRAPIPSEPVNPFGSLGSYVAVSGSQLLLGAMSASYLFRPKNEAWDTRLVIRITSQ